MALNKLKTPSMRKYHIDAEKLIRLVKDTPTLWDKSCETYKNKEKTLEAWKDISVEMWSGFNGLDEMKKKNLVQVIKKKWNNIRDRYLKSCKMMLADRSFPPAKPKYVFHNMLRFLGLTEIVTAHLQDFSGEESALEEIPQELQTEDDPLIVIVNSPPQENIVDHSCSIDQGELDDSNTIIKEELDIMDDERHLMFFKSILPSLRSFNEDQTVEFQLGVLKMIKGIRNSFVRLPVQNRRQTFFSPYLVQSPQNRQLSNFKVQSVEEVQTTPSANIEPTSSSAEIQLDIKHSSNLESDF